MYRKLKCAFMNSRESPIPCFSRTVMIHISPLSQRTMNHRITFAVSHIWLQRVAAAVLCAGGGGGGNRLWRCETEKVRKRSDKKKRWVSCQVFITPQHFETAGKKRAILSSRLHCLCSAACNYRTHAFHKWKKLQQGLWGDAAYTPNLCFPAIM